jgi:hypothetical protein
MDMTMNLVNSSPRSQPIILCPGEYGAEIATGMLIAPSSTANVIRGRRNPFQRSISETHDRLPQVIPAM